MSNRPFTRAERALLAACYYQYFRFQDDGEGNGVTRATGALIHAGKYLLRRGLVMRFEFENILDKSKSIGFKQSGNELFDICDSWSQEILMLHYRMLQTF